MVKNGGAAQNAAPRRASAPTSLDDTIAAIATSGGVGAVGIVRLSGVDAFEVAKRIFRGRRPFDEIPSHSVSYGMIVDDLGVAVDEAIMLKMRAPRTYTREDVVELQCHAGYGALRSVLRAALRAGARGAEPGEFTKRAYLNGRIDLAQAEAVMDLVSSTGEAGARVALRQLTGELSDCLGEVREKLISFCAAVGALLDYPEENITVSDASGGFDAFSALKEASEALRSLLSGFDRGRLAREGAACAIVGRPNAGKSTLLNCILGAERSIVTEYAGTTRDVVAEFRDVAGYTVRFSDTAGIRESNDAAERAGIRKADEAIREADLIIWVVDAAAGIGAEDVATAERLAGKRVIVVANKADLAGDAAAEAAGEAALAALAGQTPLAPRMKALTAAVGAAVSEVGGVGVGAGSGAGSDAELDAESDAVAAGAGSSAGAFTGVRERRRGLDSIEKAIEEALLGITNANIERAATETATGAATEEEATAAERAAAGTSATEGAAAAERATLFEGAILSNARHQELARKAYEAILAASRALEEGAPPDVAAFDVEIALDAIGRITGESYADDIVESIFSRFCLGK